MRSIRWLFVVLFLVALPKLVSAQDDVITGTVKGPGGNPVVGARVEVVSIESEITRTGITDGKGRYFVLFADGGGRYILRITYLGLADVIRTLQRSGDEELILTNITMQTGAINLGSVTGTTTRAVNAQQAGRTGEQTRELSAEQLARLPLPDLDPSTIALLAAGVTGTGADSISGRLGFSVAGMSDLLNQVVVDGVIQGAGGGAPEEGIRRTSVTTSTFDASKGGFAGGQVTQSSARGNNRKAGSLNYRYDNDALQIGAAATTNSFSNSNLGGSWGGPILTNKLFYNTSFQFGRKVDHRFALQADDPDAAIRAGVAIDSINRFLNLVAGKLGGPVVGQTGPYNQFTNDVRLQGRVDWNINQGASGSQTMSLRANGNFSGQDSTRISTLDLADHGGESDSNGFTLGGTLSSRMANNWTNNVNMSLTERNNSSVGYIEMPEGRVRVTSMFEDGTSATNTLVFGGNRSFPSEAYTRDLQLTDDLSFLQHVGTQVHRLKVGGSLQKTKAIDRSANNIFGAFSFNSLQDFEANRPSSYTRSLQERKSNTGTYNAGVYVGDTWRVSEPLEVTMGLRYDYSALDQKPEYNPVIETIFGRRTDFNPTAGSFSPRVGFNLRLSGQQNGNFQQQAKNLSGGIGLFAGRAPTNIYSTAVRQTGLPSAEQTLSCIGTAVPVPDWDLYIADPSQVPSTCADGGLGNPTQSFRAPTVTLIDPDQSLPSSLRFNIGYRTQLPKNIQANFGYSYSMGMGLWGYQDKNLNTASSTTLGNENRPFYGDINSVVSTTGAVSFASSRAHSEFGNVYDVIADRESKSHQFTGSALGFLMNRKLTLGTNYTLSFSRDQGSGSFNAATTAANPNEAEWGTSSSDRRHILNLQAAYAFTPEFEFSVNGRVQSGTPYTPLVNSDINGDGARNDRAYVFDPSAVGDTAISNGMTRLLASAPGRVVSCIEAQFGGAAERNSCRNSWTQTLDFRASIRPNLPTLQRRMTISIDGRNALTGLDQLINGANNLKGWGEGQRADANLLEVRGFDQATKSFKYTVNEGFGQTNRGPNALRSAFSLTISARVAVGGQPNQANRGFGQVGGFGGGFGGGGGGGGRGGEGGFGGGQGGFGGAGGFDVGALIQSMAGGSMNVDSILGGQLKNPVKVLIALKDSLKLTPENVAALKPISDSLQFKINKHIAAMRPVAEEIIGSVIANRATGAAAAANPQAAQQQMMQQLQQRIQPEITNGRAEATAALNQASLALGPDVWGRIPNNLKLAGPPQGGGRNGGFNAVGLLDRMLVNPIPVLLSMKDTLKLTAEQVTQIEAISEPITDLMLKARTDIGKKFDNVQGAQLGQVFQEVQPQIDAARKKATDALKAVQKVLTPEQWKRVPAAVKDPFTNMQMPGMGGARGDRGDF
ncbi:MAG: TonB-dependent receptor [Longimicrobiales bacterium]